MSHQPHNPWRARAMRAGLSIAIVALSAGAVHATPALPDMPTSSQQPASQPLAPAASRPGARPKRPRGRVRTIASGAAQSEPTGRPDVVAHAMSVRGTPYRWGGTSPVTGFDCSGLSQWAWGKAGVSIARDTRSIWRTTPRVIDDILQPGDLVFFGMGHMGIYVGGDRFIHAPQTGDVVKVTSMAPRSHYGKRYTGAVRPG